MDSHYKIRFGIHNKYCCQEGHMNRNDNLHTVNMSLGRGGSLVDSALFIRKIVRSNPALAMAANGGFEPMTLQMKSAKI